MPTVVAGEGPLDARLVIIGECPANVEVALGRPFVGAAGAKLNHFLEGVGVRRASVRIDNVYQLQAPANKIERVPKHELAEWVGDLHRRLGELTQPAVIVPMGNTALRALTGEQGITRRRGYPSAYKTSSGVEACVLPTIHPAALFRKPAWEKRVLRDWQRIAHVLEAGVGRAPAREHQIGWDELAFDHYYQHAKVDGGPMALDIETNASGVTCVGFAVSPAWSVTIPTTGTKGSPELKRAWEWVTRFCELPNEKVTHNGLFDAWWLAKYGVELRTWTWDTLMMHACLEPTSAHSLLYCASVDTWTPYWKDLRDAKEGDEEEGGVAHVSDPRVLWHYNGIDACVTRELFDVYFERLVAAGKLAFYARHYTAMVRPLLQMMSEGVRVDEKARGRRWTQLIAEVIATQDALTQVVGTSLYGPKGGLSSKKVQAYLYETLRLPKRINRQTQRATADETAIRGLMLRFPAKLAEAGALILRISKAKKHSEFFADKLISADGRTRCTYKVTPETGRLASAEAADGTGRNLQNVPHRARDVFLADEGTVFVELDASQAESRVVSVLTRDAEMVELAQTPPWAFDVHKFNAGIIFKVTPDVVTKEQRQLGKRAVHACVDAATEVLTPDGWVSIAAVHEYDEIAQWDPSTGAITWCGLSLFHKYAYDGELTVWEGHAFSQAVTAAHKMPYMTSGTHKTTTSHGLKRLPSVRLPVSGIYAHGENTLSCEDVQLAVAICADGCITPSDRVVFHLKKRRKIERLRALLAPLGSKAKITESSYSNGTTRIAFNANGLLATLGWKYHVKGWSLSVLLQWTPECLDTWLDELPLWNGSVRGSLKRYFTADRMNADCVKTIAHLRSRQAIVRRGQRVWNVSFNRRTYARRPTPYEVRHIGNVFCVTTDTGWFVVRRNGEISITGNSSYGMHGKKLAEILLKEEGVVRTADECQAMIEAYMGRFPAIREWQKQVRREVMIHRRLANPWGRELAFEHDRLDDDTYRRAYAFVPQSSIADLTNQALVAVWQWIRVRGLRARLRLQVHDALVLACPPDEVECVVEVARAAMEREVDYGGVTLRIPAELKMGMSWKATREWKKPPARGELEAAARELLA